MAERPARYAVLARTLREQRQLLGMTLRAVAQEAKLSESYVWRIEHGTRRPDADACVRLAQALQLDAAKVKRLAGFLPDSELERYVPGGQVRKAILADDHLTAEQKRLILGLYESWVPDNDSVSSSES